MLWSERSAIWLPLRTESRWHECLFPCTFCTSPQMWTQRWINRDSERIVDEMKTYVERYGATDFHFKGSHRDCEERCWCCPAQPDPRDGSDLSLRRALRTAASVAGSALDGMKT